VNIIIVIAFSASQVLVNSKNIFMLC